MDEKASRKRYSLNELAVLSGLPVRTVRFYIQRGLVDRPIGEKRTAYYTQKHAEQLILIRRWSESGVSLERISELLLGGEPPIPDRGPQPGSVEIKSHLFVTDGVEMQIEPTRAGLEPEEVRALFAAVMVAYGRVKGGRKP